MATRNEPGRGFEVVPSMTSASTRGRSGRASPDLEQELRRADDDFERGDYIELTPEQLERCVATGESPWPDESRG
jgi:hypothetical protein